MYVYLSITAVLNSMNRVRNTPEHILNISKVNLASCGSVCLCLLEIFGSEN